MKALVAGYVFEVETEEGEAKKRIVVGSENDKGFLRVEHKDVELRQRITKELCNLLNTRILEITPEGAKIDLFDVELDDLKKIADVNFEERRITIKSDAIKEIVDKAKREIEEERRKRKEIKEKREKLLSELGAILKELTDEGFDCSLNNNRVLIKYLDQTILYEKIGELEELENALKRTKETLQNKETIINEAFKRRIEELQNKLEEEKDRKQKLEAKYEKSCEFIRAKELKEDFLEFLKEQREKDVEEEIKEEFSEIFDDY